MALKIACLLLALAVVCSGYPQQGYGSEQGQGVGSGNPFYNGGGQGVGSGNPFSPGAGGQGVGHGNPGFPGQGGHGGYKDHGY